MSDTRMSKPVLHHVTLKTTRLDEMVEWYANAVGMRANHHDSAGAWLTNDEANHRMAMLTVPGLKDDPDKVPHTGMHHVAFEYGGIDGLLETYERLKKQGITPHATLDHGLTTSLYYLDPDGNSVELQADNFGDWGASSEWMRTAPEFNTNPIGVNADPEQLHAAWRAGADAAELHRRSYAGEFDPGTPLDLRLPTGAVPQSSETDKPPV
ncbi:VOC family protein [Candidatus Dormibacter sp.]|uniref:VOC family protein n=1 Tax=Candidatus Dormibacter sp. TaxID=2973982 RepID=UPI003D9BA361